VRIRGIDVELVEETIPLAGRELVVVRPEDSEALLVEEAFEREEYLPYWAELWPSGIALARAIAARSLGGLRVLELGCGLGLPSIAAALAGARVLATDWSDDAVAMTALNAQRNGAALETAVVDWSAPDPLVARAPWPLVLASDVLYERRNADLLLELLPRLVDERGEILLADPARPHTEAFLAAAANDGWTIRTVVERPPSRVSVHRLTRPLRPASMRAAPASHPRW
jgi:predicted nicotinamide N-methyase